MITIIDNEQVQETKQKIEMLLKDYIGPAIEDATKKFVRACLNIPSST
jgi:hypothetical protein